jgi:hypothetical protein
VHSLHPIELTYAAAFFTVLLQQNDDIGEIEGDALKQVDAIKSSAHMVCTKYTELAAAAATTATKGDTTPNKVVSVTDRIDPVAEQQQQQQMERLEDAIEELEHAEVRLPLGGSELAEVHSIITAAIAGNTGASVHVYGKSCSGNTTAVLQQLDGPVKEWCKQHTKLEPVSFSVDSCYLSPTTYPAGLYGEVLEKLKRYGMIPIGEVSKVTAEAKKQLEAVVLNTNTNLPMIVLNLRYFDKLLPKHTDELRQFFEWTAGSKLILITEGKTDLTQTMP